MKKRKVAKLMAVVALVGAVGVGGSLALLTAQSETVTNTFTVGKGLHNTDINLDEAKVDENGKEIVGEGAGRTQTNSYNNLEQGDKLDKDPTVTISTTAADCYVFALVDGLKENTDIYQVAINENWMKVTDIPDEVKGQVPAGAELYVYTANKIAPTVVQGGLQGEAGLVFDGVKIVDDADLFTPVYGEEDQEGVIIDYKPIDLEQIVVKACAVQATNNSYDDALKMVKFGD